MAIDKRQQMERAKWVAGNKGSGRNGWQAIKGVEEMGGRQLKG